MTISRKQKIKKRYEKLSDKQMIMVALMQVLSKKGDIVHEAIAEELGDRIWGKKSRGGDR